MKKVKFNDTNTEHYYYAHLDTIEAREKEEKFVSLLRRQNTWTPFDVAANRAAVKREQSNPLSVRAEELNPTGRTVMGSITSNTLYKRRAAKETTVNAFSASLENNLLPQRRMAKLQK